jgi:periplasmic copper chaperone A
MSKTVVMTAAATGALALVPAAFGHPTMSPPVAKARVLQQFTLAVPTEEEGATTRSVELFVPQGFDIDSFEPSPGWTRSEDPDSYTWAGGRVPTDEDAVFRFNASLDSSKTYTFKVRQAYSNGKIVNWTGSESSDTPAPRVEGVSSLGGGGTSTLAIIALIVGAVGVLIGIAGLATRGRPLT